jgi:hypothetical protein
MITRRNFLKVGGLTVAASGWVSKWLGASAPNQESPLQNMVADVKPLTAEDYAARIEKAKRLIAENKLDALFLEGGMNLQYFTKVNWWRSERTFGAVFSPKRDPVWVCPAFERAETRRDWSSSTGPPSPRAAAASKRKKRSLSWTWPTRSPSWLTARPSRISAKG